MKNALKIFVSIVLLGSYIMTGCAKDNTIGGDPPGAASAHMYVVRGRVTEIAGKNLVLVEVMKRNRDFQREDTVAIKYDVSQEIEAGPDNLEGSKVRPMEVQVGDFVSAQYSGAERRDIGEIKDCNYISTWYLDIIPKERYESMYSDDADES